MTENLTNTTNNFHKAGQILIIVGLIVCLFPYFIIYGGPIFIIGALMIWISKNTLKRKLLWTFVPLVLWYPSMGLLAYFASNHVTSATYLIPTNFRGEIQILSFSTMSLPTFCVS
jgi:hypothetical protein